MALTILWLHMLLHTCLLCVQGGWSQEKGNARQHRSWGWNHGRDNHYGKGSQYNGYYNHRPRSDSMQETFAAYFVDSLLSREGRRRDRRSRSYSSSRSSSRRDRSRRKHSRTDKSSQRSELEELRAYKESHEKKIAAEKSLEVRKAEELERKREFEALEARILQAIPKAPQAYTNSGSNGTSDEISAKSRKLIEALLDDELSLEGVTSWDEVQKRVGALKPAVLKSILQVRTSETLPRSNAGKVDAAIAYLRAQCRA